MPTVKAHPLSRCSNLQCRNRANEGQFVILDMDVDVGAHRTISIVLCAPCGSAMEGVLSR